MEEEIIMDLTNNCTTNIIGRMLELPPDITPRVKEKSKENSSSDILMLRQSSVSAPVIWRQYWEEPRLERSDELWYPLGILPQRLVDPLYGRDILDTQLDEMAAAAPGIEQVWKITESWPSLTKLLLEERNNE